ncbi:unnamed protein product [Phaedon cochleariae]|uniref:Uncharacterized protein n=1 Tax=Phaedon cochleariae TaxID=80249 RepID=A0A9N9SAX7_PHACE|nr:unnamed protein product [Phaedon cochleariae]
MVYKTPPEDIDELKEESFQNANKLIGKRFKKFVKNSKIGCMYYCLEYNIDNVHYPSWQAQLTGKKRWKFSPPPECYNICHSMDILVEPGEIIVADTNRWYHQTVIMEGDLSITIGSEFD